MTRNIAGDTPRQERLWRTYLYWARSAVDPATLEADLEISRPSARLPDSQARKLQAVLFISLALEYRLKRSLEALNLRLPKRIPLGTLLEEFKTRIELGQRMDGQGQVKLPRAWGPLKKRLMALVTDRNKIVHGHHLVLLLRLKNHGYSRRRLYSHFNALIEAMALINVAAGRSPGGQKAERSRLRRVKVRPRSRRLTTA